MSREPLYLLATAIGVAPVIWAARQLPDWTGRDIGLFLTICGGILIGLFAVCVAVDIRQGHYRPRDFLRWPPPFLRSVAPPNRRD
jgi:hypothetical protein